MTDLWLIWTGDQYPLAEILGTDLSPTQSTWWVRSSWVKSRSTDWCRVPPNVKFEIDDCEEEWTFTQPYDYIHSRYMIGSIRNWPRLVAQSYNHDFDARYYSEDVSLVKVSPIDSWVTTWMKASNDAGRDHQPGRNCSHGFRKPGLKTSSRRNIVFLLGLCRKTLIS